MWLLAQLGPKGKAKVVSLLDSKEARTRLVAYRALRRTGQNMLAHAKKLVNDPDMHVRRDVALSLRHYRANDTAELFVELAKYGKNADKNYLEAIGLGAENKESEIWRALEKAMVSDGKWSPWFAKLTWRLWPEAAVPDLKARALDSSLSEKERLFAMESLFYIESSVLHVHP